MVGSSLFLSVVVQQLVVTWGLGVFLTGDELKSCHQPFYLLHPFPAVSRWPRKTPLHLCVSVCVCVAGRQWWGRLGSEVFIYSFFGGMQDLSSPTGDRTHDLCNESPDSFFSDVLYFLLNYIIPHYSFLFFLNWAALSLHCCSQAFSSCSERGQLLCRLLTVVASLIAEHWL